MALIEWRSAFNVGVPSVDHEHQELIKLINDLHAHVQQPQPALTVGEFLGEIYARIAAHFALEERVMREHRYDQYADHKADHERLLDEIRDIMDDYMMLGAFNETVLAERLRDWFTEHFRIKDARLHAHLG